jgi:hypothetical protein
MLLRLAALLLALVPATAAAGLRAVYVPSMGYSTEVKVADNGDLDADLGGGRRLVVRGARSYVVTERLTGPIVHRLEDMATLAGDRWTALLRASPETGAVTLVPLGPTVVHGRTGTAYGWPKPPPASQGPQKPLVVLSDDSGLKPLAAAMRRVWNAQALVLLADHPDWPEVSYETLGAMLRMLERGAPLKYGGDELQTLERGEVQLAPLDPAEVESLDALRARQERERREEEAPSNDTNVSRAVFAEGRLWLVTDDGGLTSLAEGEGKRRPETLGGPVLDICAGPDGLIAVTGTHDGSQWTLRRRAGPSWGADQPVRRAGDTLVALSCSGPRPVLLTTKRLIEPGRRIVTLSGDVRAPLVGAVVHETPDYFFVGLNLGEWGGGLVRIERRTGRTITIERQATRELCDGPLNTGCDPVHGVATIPWKPNCVAVAVGLIHFMAHGRIAVVCGTTVEQMFTQATDRRRSDSKTLAEVAKGGYGSVAFFGLAATRGGLLAVGHDGLYRLNESGRASHQPWPRFKEVGGLLVSFALPDVVLVLTTINRHASISGAAPILAVR